MDAHTEIDEPLKLAPGTIPWEPLPAFVQTPVGELDFSSYATEETFSERRAYVLMLVSRRTIPFDAIRAIAHRYKLSHTSARDFYCRIREETLIKERNKSNEDYRAEALLYWESIVVDPTSSDKRRDEAQRQIDYLTNERKAKRNKRKTTQQEREEELAAKEALDRMDGANNG